MVPDFQSLMLPLLRALSDGETKAYSEVRSRLAEDLAHSEAALSEMLPSGKQTVYHNRFGWAKTYLAKAGLLSSPARAVLQITPLGMKVLPSSPDRITINYLKQFPAFSEFINRTESGNNEAAQQTNGQVAVLTVPEAIAEPQETPEEIFESAYQRLRRELEAELLDQVKAASPAFFERLVVDLLLKMGYGGSREDAGEAIGRTGDGGIDGIIKEDRLGLDAIYVQAKRWQNTVGRPDIQGFSGSLDGVRAKKGVFITTSQFSAEARDYVARIEKKIVLIDGATLARYMVDYGVGVSTMDVYEIKRVDSDYFGEG